MSITWFNNFFDKRFLCLNCPCYNVCEKCEGKMEHDPNHIMRVLGIEFIEEEIQQKRSMISKLRNAVAKKKAQLIGTFVSSNDVNKDPEEETLPKKKKVKRGLFS